MANHIDFDEEIAQTWEASKKQNNTKATGHLIIDYDDVTWEQEAFMRNAKRSTKIVTEDLGAGSPPLEDMQEMFSATTDMFQSFKMNAHNFKTEANLFIKPQNRLPKVNDNGKLSFEQGYPSTISFPHIGKRTTMEQSQTPLPTSLDRIVYEQITVTAKLEVRTYFSGNVTLTQGWLSKTDDINDHLFSAGVMEENNGQVYFVSNGLIEIQVKKDQAPSENGGYA